jgi:NADH dehydrogenase [ubiquinone] 1 alpha subcomplex assembly factor 7
VTPLARRLAERIRRDGALSIADYMSEALGDPDFGYYRKRDPFGAAGDFVTSPEISQIFGELIGLWCAASWEQMGCPDPVILAELGPGRGTLMADALRAIAVAADFRRALRLHLVETSPMLRQAQATRLAAADPTWHDSIATLPAGPLILVANEFLDALPLHQFVRDQSGWRERRVGLDEDGELAFTSNAPDAPAMTALIPQALRDAAVGDIFETRPAATSLARALGTALGIHPGIALFIDYGHEASACGDTLQAVRRHRPEPVLAAPGEADLTAHVDFAAFADAAATAGARVWGPVPQGAFLAALGIAERAEQLLRHATAAQIAALESACRRLLDPGEMGTLFKVLALAYPSLSAPAGFAEGAS